MCYHLSHHPNFVMRLLLAFSVTAILAVYTVGALYFLEQERWARDPTLIETADYDGARHPDAILGLVQLRFEARHFGSRELSLVRDGLKQAPSFYQGPFLLATYRANRLERALSVRASYEAALERYPANGRLHVAYASWLLDSRTRLSGWQDPDGGTELRDPLPDVESHLRRGMALEPELTWTALEALEGYHVPPARWPDLTPDDPLARRHLLDALARGHYYDVGLDILRAGAFESDDVALLRTGAQLALEGGDGQLALRTAIRWKEILDAERVPSTSVLAPVLQISRAYMALGQADAANRALEDLLGEVERKHGPSSRITLSLLCSLGDEYLTRGQWVTAESLYAQAVARDSGFVPALFGLARCLRHSGDLSGAVVRLEELLDIRPDHESARRELKALLRAMP